MPIPRLAPADAPLVIDNIQIHEKLVPYFQIWFQRRKLAGETPKQFGKRMWKIAALNDYLMDEGTAQANAIEKTKTDALDALNRDIKNMDGEIG